ncbi:KinB-signaling pathway activation protein [Virgibacillus sediminis]|uniref:KinB-signaling pathway activation protein n=1 Tax=Virgibacillus sediminis TaxID=202260 RepID=A0ABV7A8L2_9BACI
MNSRKLVGFLFRTFLLGGVVGLITSFFVKAEDYARYLSPFDAFELLGLVIFFLGIGFVFAAVSQTGFFAYLFINRFGLSLFRIYWPTVQVLLIAFVVFDLIYFPYRATDGVALYWFILMAGAILGYGWIIAKIKASETNQRAFIPALFLMVVMTTIEWIPGMQVEGIDYAILMIFPLLACNTYQLLVLHRIQGDSKSTAGKA